MLIVERQERLLQFLKERNTADLESMSKEIGVSTSTVRRDLEELEKKGLVSRTHGGAIYREPQRNSMHLTTRMEEQVEAKRLIGRHVAGMVEPQMTVLLDGGSTVYYAAEMIKARPIQVVTNSLAISNLFSEDEQVELVLIGGLLYPRTGVMVGPIARKCLQDLHADLLLFSLAGIYDGNCFNQNLAMAEGEEVMLQQAARKVLLMDSTKFGRKSLARVCKVDDVDLVVTDPGVDEQWVTQLEDKLLVAKDDAPDSD